MHGRVIRSIEGFIRFLRISFLDFFPALLTGFLAIAATLAKQPWLALAMVGVIPVSLAITAWQLLCAASGLPPANPIPKLSPASAHNRRICFVVIRSGTSFRENA